MKKPSCPFCKLKKPQRWFVVMGWHIFLSSHTLLLQMANAFGWHHDGVWQKEIKKIKGSKETRPKYASVNRASKGRKILKIR